MSETADTLDMDKNQPMDVAKEPVDLNDDAAFMDTGVLHEGRVCVECGNDLAIQGHKYCSDCLEVHGE